MIVRITKRYINNIFSIVCVLFISSELSALDFVSPDSARIINPKGAMIRSAIIPGWGHLYVKKPAKAAIYFSLEAYHLYQFNKYNSIYQHVKETKETIGIDEWNTINDDENYTSIEEKRKAKILAVTGYHLNDATWRPREIRNKYAWWCVGFYFIGMLDALVDAHLYYFPSDDVELTVDHKSKSVGMRLSWNIGRTDGN